jgi:hypothetical protein
METRVDLEISKHFPYLDTKNIKVFIPKVVYEFAQYLDPEKMQEIGKFDIDKSICLEMENQHLIIVYEGLYGEKNFEELARLFNRIDPEFNAYYTDAAIDIFTYKRFYALCLNTECFLKQIFPTKNPLANINLHPVKKGNLFRRSNWAKEREESHIYILKPLNHYAVPPIQAEIMIRKTAIYTSKTNMKVERAIFEWKNKRSAALFAEKVFLLSNYLNLNFDQFPRELFSILVSLVIDRLAMETENKLSLMNPSTYDNLLLFKNVTGLKQQESRIMELSFLVFENYCFREFAILDDYAVLKFAAVDIVMECELFNRFHDVMGEAKDFWYEQHRNEKTSISRCEYSDIYICFPNEKLTWFREKLENIKIEIQQIQQNEYLMSF